MYKIDKDVHCISQTSKGGGAAAGGIAPWISVPIYVSSVPAKSLLLRSRKASIAREFSTHTANFRRSFGGVVLHTPISREHMSDENLQTERDNRIHEQSFRTR